MSRSANTFLSEERECIGNATLILNTKHSLTWDSWTTLDISLPETLRTELDVSS